MRPRWRPVFVSLLLMVMAACGGLAAEAPGWVLLMAGGFYFLLLEMLKVLEDR